MVSEYEELKHEMEDDDFKWTIPKLKIAIRCKKQPGEKMATKKNELEAQWERIQDRPTPHCSPVNSDDEDEPDDDAEEGDASVSSECNDCSDIVEEGEENAMHNECNSVDDDDSA